MNKCEPYLQGVDIARNYDFKFGWDEIGSTSDPCDETYRGEFAFSEKESQAIRDLILKYKA